MAGKIILSADSACDLSSELKERCGIQYYPFQITLGERHYMDGVDIFPDDLYRAWREERLLPKTAAVGVGEYMDYFSGWVAQGYEVIHLNIGSSISAAHQNCLVAAKELGHVYPVDSGNLSSGIGLLALEAFDRIERGIPAPLIQKELQALTRKVHASFVLDTLEFMAAGGRCSTAVALGANLLNLKPCIMVNNKDASMTVGKKYRGNLEKVLPQYVRDTLSGRDDVRENRVFIVNSGISPERVKLVRKAVRQFVPNGEIYEARASCTISSHCGPNTLGVMFMTR
ncbi:MAG TPA: DegV family protein [Candidatus Gallacutalibacter stercoravium]|nr:DegV family protein [Candidatus Gallacutalibacter stercoravium]